jgi:hypothetical protein
VIHPGLSTRLRVLLDAMDADVGVALADLGLTDYRTRYSAVIRRLAAGPGTIGDVRGQPDRGRDGAARAAGPAARR